MSKAYSLDLRQRVLKYLEEGHDKQSAANVFSIGIATIYRWLRLRKKTGSLEPRRKKFSYRKIDYEQLRKHVKMHPDQFLSEMAEEFSVTEQAIFYALKKLKITRKKRQLSTGKGMKKRDQFSAKN